MRLIRLSMLATVTLATLSACAPAPTISLAEFYSRSGGQPPHRQPKSATVGECIDPLDDRHPAPSRGNFC